MEEPLVEFQGVTKRFNNRTILDRVSLKIYEGHITTLIGKSGTGKSVLLKHIIGLLSPDEGRILFRGKPIDSMKKSECDAYRSQISYMFQNNALFDSLTVFENIALPLRETTKMNKKEIESNVMAQLVQTELTEVAHRYPSQLSGGMQKRVALGRALVTNPRIVLFDEPTTGQDPIRKNAILNMIGHYQKQFGFTALLISHDIPDIFFISNRILVLYDGMLIFQGTYQELDQLEHPIVDEFVKSLEGFRDELTGLHSSKDFRRLYGQELSERRPDEGFWVAVFIVSDIDLIGDSLGHTAAQEVIQSLGEYVNRHFGEVGISTRLGRDYIVTILPYADAKEAQRMIDELAKDLQGKPLYEIQAEAQAKIRSDDCFEFSILAGLTEGKAGEDIEITSQRAISRQKTIARYRCQVQGEAK